MNAQQFSPLACDETTTGLLDTSRTMASTYFIKDDRSIYSSNIKKDYHIDILNSLKLIDYHPKYDKLAIKEEEWYSRSLFDNYLDITTAATNTTATYHTWQHTATTTGLVDWGYVPSVPYVVAPGTRLREILRSRSAPLIIGSRQFVRPTTDVREQRARETLCRLIGDETYKKFLRDGFVTVVSKKGLTYRIYPGHKFTEVYDKGIMVERLCVVLQGDFPATDSLIMRYLLITNDEDQFSSYANKHGALTIPSRVVKMPDTHTQPLPDIWKRLVA